MSPAPRAGSYDDKGFWCLAVLGQLGVVDLGAVRLAKQSGSCVVIDRCPKIELMRP